MRLFVLLLSGWIGLGLTAVSLNAQDAQGEVLTCATELRNSKTKPQLTALFDCLVEMQAAINHLSRGVKPNRGEQAEWVERSPQTTAVPVRPVAESRRAPSPLESPTSQFPREMTNSIGMEFVWIPAGEFIMGSLDSNRQAFNDEKPAHRVTISEPFYMGKYEVTQAEWEAVMGTTVQEQRDKANEDGELRGIGDEYPMYYVSWEDVQAFIEKLNAKDGETSCRLPTEAQWEYAARAGRQDVYSFGSDAAILDEYAWYTNNSDDDTHPVGTRKPNAWGLYDMHGNVWEWVDDGPRTYLAEAVTDPRGPDTVDRGVVRGGSWRVAAILMRSAIRITSPSHSRVNDLGFRCMSLVPR